MVTNETLEERIRKAGGEMMWWQRNAQEVAERDARKEAPETPQDAEKGDEPTQDMKEVRPSYYGGPDDPYEAIKVIDAWNLGFNLGNVVKYISRAGRKGDALEDLEKARTYLEFEMRKQMRKTEEK